ncbi:pseudouridine synthase [Emticicia oligotrophica DSM 17448]|uniref:tRNA pseudouridine synthase C n=1 Tax=Emticicia oligotrophica (strain DSM 17448 / CIP 109782 / MTCC 6937 / GPTSA100-15) TaxID=929562 RepID=A0ABM5MY89_EMTOG|nr:pseudouridine synthase [Emticicia oligotrophica]AFK02127.1 pseudouridine synthase [Emticicia oligotrophica DSM 17448]
MQDTVLPILYQDEYYVAINKPHNLLVHRSSIAAEESVFALQLLRDQLNCWVSPCHRIDRKTSGVLLFALSPEADRAMKTQFENQQTHKKYLALVRGYLPELGMTDRPLAKENGTLQEAITHFRCLKQVELEIEVSRYPTSRYSLAEITPETGRMHQIRRHFAQLRHYLIGDKTYGECKHNKMFEQRFGLNTMLLHASELKFTHPFTGETIEIQAPLSDEFSRILAAIGMN